MPLKFDTTIEGPKVYFNKDHLRMVEDACSARGVTLKDLAEHIGTTRIDLMFMLKGQDVMPRRLWNTLQQTIADWDTPRPMGMKPNGL